MSFPVANPLLSIQISVTFTKGGGFPQTQALQPDGGCPLRLVRKFEFLNGCKVSLLKTVGTDDRIRQYNMERIV